MPNMYKIVTLQANAQKIATFKMNVAQHMCKTITVQGKC